MCVPSETEDFSDSLGRLLGGSPLHIPANCGGQHTALLASSVGTPARRSALAQHHRLSAC